MTGGDIAGLIAAGVFLVLTALLAIPLIKLGGVFDELRAAIRESVDSLTPTLAETHVTVRRRMGGRATVLNVRLLTGRKHQIRVHLQHAGHPIAGDDRYGDPGFNRRVASLGGTGLHLHAAKMVIPMPDGPDLVVEAPTPARWDRLLASGL